MNKGLSQSFEYLLQTSRGKLDLKNMIFTQLFGIYRRRYSNPQ